MADFKIICTESYPGSTTVGKIYEVVDGKFKFDNGDLSWQYKDIDDINNHCVSTFELVPELPRICYILGGEDNPLKIGEKFALDYVCVKDEFIYSVNSDGKVCIDDSTHYLRDNTICDIINQPEKIIRQPRFSEEQIGTLKVLKSLGFDTLDFDCDDLAVMSKNPDVIGDNMVHIPTNLFPQITGNFNFSEYLEGLK